MPIQSTNILSRGRNRRNIPASARKSPAAIIASDPVISTTKITLTLSLPAMLSGIPQFLTAGVNGALPVSAQLTAPNTLELTYAATQAASTTLTIPENDPALRTYLGGFVAAQVFDLVP